MRFRRAMQILITLLAAYVGLALLVMLMQRRLIYYPATFSPETAAQLASEEGFREWRNANGELIGWHWPAKGTATGAVLVLHGNAGCAFHRNYLAQPIHEAASVDVFVLEYPGYGCRAGSPSQRTILAAAEDALHALSNRPVYVVSESLGAGPAAYLAEKHPARVTGLVMFAPYDKLASVGQRQFPFLPVGLLLRDRFDPASSLRHYRGPVNVVLAENDMIIPAVFGQRLYDGYNGPKSLEIISGAGHNDIAGQLPEWWMKTFAFLQANEVR